MKRFFIQLMACLALPLAAMPLIPTSDITYDAQGNAYERRIFTQENNNVVKETFEVLLGKENKQWYVVSVNKVQYIGEKSQTLLTENYPRDAEGVLTSNPSQFINQYNQSGLNTEQIYQVQINEAWITLSKDNTEYDSNGKIITKESLRWNINPETQKPIINRGYCSKTSISREDQTEEIIQYAYNGNDEGTIVEWELTSKRISNYQSGGNIVSSITTDKNGNLLAEERYDDFGFLINYTDNRDKWEGKNDELGRPVDRVYYRKDNNLQWVPFRREIREYASNGIITLSENYYYGTINASDEPGWIGEGRRQRGFVDPRGNYILVESCEWDPATQQWIIPNGNYDGERKEIFEFDNQGVQTGVESYRWIDSLGYWKGVEKNKRLIDKQGRMVLSARFRWNDQVRQWDLIQRTQNVYVNDQLYSMQTIEPSSNIGFINYYKYDNQKRLSVVFKNIRQNNEWVPSERIEFHYSSVGGEEVLTRQNFQKMGTLDWENNGWKIILYTTTGGIDSKAVREGETIKVYGEGGTIAVDQLNEGDRISIFSTEGTLLQEREASNDVERFGVESGTYLIRVNKAVSKLRVK